MSIPPATTTATATAAAAASTFGLLLPTPSSLDGVPAHVEARLRAYGCGLIVRACAAMTQSEKRGDDNGDKDPKQGEAAAAAAAPPPIAVPAAAAATAQALLHRFYARHSLARPATGDVRRVAAAMTWLALKLEDGYGDAHRVTRRLLLVFARLEARDDAAAADAAAAAEAAKKKDAPPASSPPSLLPLLLAYSRPYEQRRASLCRIERLALDASGFSCAVEHPHKLLLGLSHVLSSPSSTSSSSSSPSLAEEAWALANDSLRTPLCMRFGPEVVAAGCLFLASRRLGVALPEGGEGEEEGEDDGGGKGGGEGGNNDDDGGGGGKSSLSSPASPPPPSGPWWRLLGVSTADVFEVARVVAALLEAEPPGYEDASAWLRGKREREGGAGGGGGERAATATATATAAAATAAAAAAAGLRPPSALGSAAASAVAKARAAAARAAAARKKPRR